MESEKVSINMIIAILSIAFLLIVGIIVILGSNSGNDILSEDKVNLADVSNETIENKIEGKKIVKEKKKEIEDEAQKETIKLLVEQGIDVKNYYIDEDLFAKDNIAKIYNQAINKIFLNDKVAVYDYIDDSCVMTVSLDTKRKILYLNDNYSDDKELRGEAYSFYKNDMFRTFSKPITQDYYDQIGIKDTLESANRKLANLLMGKIISLKTLLILTNNNVEEYYLENDVQLDSFEDLFYRIVFKFKINEIPVEMDVYINKMSNLIYRINMFSGTNIVEEFKYNPDDIVLPREVDIY